MSLARKNACRPLLLNTGKELYAYMFGIFNAHKCYVYKINGMAEHIHVVFDLSPTVALADIVKSIKQSSSLRLKAN